MKNNINSNMSNKINNNNKDNNNKIIGMKKIFPIATLVWPYLSALQVVLMSEDVIWGYIWFVFNLFMIVFTIVGANVIKKDKNIKPSEILKWNMKIKCIQIPYYIGVGVVIAAFSMVLLYPDLLFIDYTGSIVAMLVASDIILQLSTSSYAYAGLKRAKKDGTIKKGLRILLTILSSILCYDVLASVLSYIVVKRNEDKLEGSNAVVKNNTKNVKKNK